jgi:hypothetical protein
MKRSMVAAGVAAALFSGLLQEAFASHPPDDPAAEEMKQRVEQYFKTCFEDLKGVAERKPTIKTFRDFMAPIVEKTEGFFGGTLIDPDWEIQQVYFKRNFLARGFSLRKVDQLVPFIEKMAKSPEPQLSEPGHGSLVQPRLVAMRYPVVENGELTAIVSMMVRTEHFLEAVGLDKVEAFQILCLGTLAEEKGELSESPHRVTLKLPSTEWEILFD